MRAKCSDVNLKAQLQNLSGDHQNEKSTSTAFGGFVIGCVRWWRRRPAKAAPVMSIQYYGAPMPQASGGATAKADVVGAASDAGASETVTTLTQALAAQGVTAAVTPVTMSATALHDLVMSVNGGVRPTNDHLTVQPTGYAVVNFQLDDMVTSADDPAQVAAINQFQSDLTTFILQQRLAAKETFILSPIPTCDFAPGHTAGDGLGQAESNAVAVALAFQVGTVPRGTVTDANGVTTDPYLIAHMGAYCRTPDARRQTRRSSVCGLAQRPNAWQ